MIAKLKRMASII